MKYRKGYFYIGLLVLIIAFYGVKSVFEHTSTFPVVLADSIQLEGTDSKGTDHYWITQKSYADDGLRPYDGDPVTFDIIQYAASSSNANLNSAVDKHSGKDVLSWGNGSGWVEWDIHIPQDGLYSIEVIYEPLRKSTTSIYYKLEIDGDIPFSEAKSIEFVKNWKDEKYPYDQTEIGNEIRALQVDVTGWKKEYIANYSISSEPLQFYFKKGNHILRFTAMNEPMLWQSITLKAPPSIDAYAQYKQKYEQSTNHRNWSSIIEAERYALKSHTTIQTGSHSEPHVSPDPQGRIIYNVIDGNRWKKPGEWIEWELIVPSSDWYEIDLKYFQRSQGKANVYRTIQIDGEVPFSEMLAYRFPSNTKLEVHTLANEYGEPFQFYLTEGTHVIRMNADASLQYPAVLAVFETMQNVYKIEQEVRKVTGDYGGGIGGDRDRTWDLMSYLPDIQHRLEEISSNLELIMGFLDGLNQNKTDATNAMKIGIDILNDLREEVDEIPMKLNKLSDLQSMLGTWLDTLSDQGMTTDLLIVRTPSTHISLKESGPLSRLSYTSINFFRSFYLKYDNRHLQSKDELELWIGRGRDYANLLQEMINQDFTPKTGINVNINLMPDPNALTLSLAAGDQPDIVLGIHQDMPIDYAMREAAADLTQFPEFEEIISRFNPGIMRSFYYNQGVYALPENQSYHLMFYRNSIFEELGIEVPDTWEDVHRILPTLQENGMNFYYPALDYGPFFYQIGANFYTDDGLAPNFDSEIAYRAFELWTDLFGKHDLPKEVPQFFHHFKLGDIPIGVADFNTYVQLLVAAPEIRGDWSVVPMPGIRQANGEVARWAQNGLSASMILEKSNMKDEAWLFMDWWTSDDVQLQYGSNIEAFIGLEFRWNTANMKAMEDMPWPAEDIIAIKEANRWVRNVPFVPGGYYLGREMEFAWNRAVVERRPPKESLDKAFVSLMREMDRKQKDLKITEDYQLHVPSMDLPYDWGAKNR